MPLLISCLSKIERLAASEPRLSFGRAFGAALGAFAGRVHASVAALRSQPLSRPSGARPSLVWCEPSPHPPRVRRRRRSGLAWKSCFEERRRSRRSSDGCWPSALHGFAPQAAAVASNPPASSAFGVRILSVRGVRLRCGRLGFLAGGPASRGLSARCPPGLSRFAKARGRRAGRHADEGRQRRCPARRQPEGTLRPGRSASFRLVERAPPFLPRRASRPIPGRDRRARDPRGAGPLGPSAPGRRFSLATKSETNCSSLC